MNDLPAAQLLTLCLLQVSRIKERVEEKEGIPPVQQRLIYGGKQMYERLPTRDSLRYVLEN